jgi:hypothetical protein
MTRLRAAGCALLLAAAGCSGGGGDFAAEAGAVCADYDERIAAVGAPADLDALAASAAEIAGLIEEGTARLRELEPPEEQAAGFAEWLALNDRAAASARELSDAAGAGERERIVELAEQAERDEARADGLARELGLADCVVASGR